MPVAMTIAKYAGDNPCAARRSDAPARDGLGAGPGAVVMAADCGFAATPGLAFLRRDRRRRADAPDLDHALPVLRAVVVHLAGMVNHVAASRRGNGAVGIELLAGAHPPGAGDHREEAVVLVKVGPAHVARIPFDARDVRPGFRRVAIEDRLLVRAVRILHPADVVGRDEIHRGADRKSTRLNSS